MQQLDIASQQARYQALTQDMASADFWNDNLAAQRKAKEHARLDRTITPWLQLQASVDELRELAALEDETLTADIQARLTAANEQFDTLKNQLKLSGKYDKHEVILSVYAGAGGTDAQDWADMLLRMYLRWAEAEGAVATLLQQSSGDEAGIKSATVELTGGSYLYGRLKGEHGVHRLVRQSPFNSDNLRQTSFAMIEIVPKIDQPDEVVIDEKDLSIDVYRSGGKGGQSVNTTDSAVRITHEPTGISVAIQNERSQIQNKETALTILRSRLAQLQLEQHAEKIEALKGPSQSAQWGNQIRSYVLHPYKQVKDLRTKYETSNPEAVLDGGINPFIEAYLEADIGTVA